VVTFQNTDPLFAIDISNPSDPRILGELKIPGFSTYMHPLSETQLIGLGYDAIDLGNRAAIQGIQVSLFDTRRPTNLSRTDVKIHERGSSTPATADHRAFFMDQSESLFGFPFKVYNSTKQFDSHFSGALFYKVQGDQLSEEIRVTHEELISESCPQQSLPMRPWWANSVSSPDIQRIFKLAGDIVTVSQSGLKSFRLADTLEVTEAVSWSSDCD
jgi:inhibitor of cysteine peptidase